MNEIKQPIGQWEVIKTTGGHGVYEIGWGFVAIHDASSLEHWEEGQARRRALMSAAPDMALALEMIAAEDDAARHNGTPLLTSGVRMTLDAALIKAGRKAAPEPVRHVTIAGVRDE
ncbi:hypothetical protein [Burkholderia multivorans]|uniref:hypothetical protein n=1 Tax=Burkholderia multivorans TaxID=87883 RepID=UPI0020B2D9EE|nr:hypothetical protein [Burkholderia multivorans]